MGLNIRQKKFADYVIESGNASMAYHKAGYQAEGNAAEVGASRLLRNVKVMEYINERNAELDTQFIADIIETKRFWTDVMRDEGADMRDRLRASEYIAKTNGAFIEKRELQNAAISEIRFGFIDPTLPDRE